MSPLFSVSLTSGILSGILVWLCTVLSVPPWLAFLGATSFFASPIKGGLGLVQVWLTNFSGAVWAMLIISIAGFVDIDVVGHLATAVFAFVMCFQASVRLFKFIPGTFLGAIAIFSSQGDWLTAILALFLGAVFGFMMTVSGDYLHRKTTSQREEKQEQVA